jgi:small GTP-binding protein
MDKEKLKEDINKQVNINKKEIRIGIVGNVDVGKTSLISVLTNNLLDNGRGSARSLVMKHLHEQTSGRTSSITLNFMRTYFNSIEELNNKENKQFYDYDNKPIHFKHKTNENKYNASIKGYKNENVINLIDLAGHEKYLKTTIRGINGCMVDYVCILVGANSGVQRMTKEHLGVVLGLKLPIIIVITKIDMAPKNILKETIQSIKNIFHKRNIKTMNINDTSDIKIMKEFYKSGNYKSIIPIFKLSSVSGEGLPNFKQFIFNLDPYKRYKLKEKQSPHFIIESTYQIKGIGIVVSGTMKDGIIKKGDILKLGPYKTEFINIIIKSIHNNFKENVAVLRAGEGGCFAIKIASNNNKHNIEIKRNLIKKGMRIMKNNKCFYEFEAEVLILHHSTTIKENYQPTIHCGTITQTAKICSMEQNILRTGDKSKIRFRFMYRPEYIEKNNYLIFREGQTKGIGKVINVF